MSRLAQETYPNVSSSLPPGDMRKPAALAFAAQCCDPGCKPKWTTWDDASGSSPKASRNGATSFWNQTAFRQTAEGPDRNSSS
jgi:hypothetical protein